MDSASPARRSGCRWRFSTIDAEGNELCLRLCLTRSCLQNLVGVTSFNQSVCVPPQELGASATDTGNDAQPACEAIGADVSCTCGSGMTAIDN
jgi:hypothetical protein